MLWSGRHAFLCLLLSTFPSLSSAQIPTPTPRTAPTPDERETVYVGEFLWKRLGAFSLMFGKYLDVPTSRIWCPTFGKCWYLVQPCEELKLVKQTPVQSVFSHEDHKLVRKEDLRSRTFRT